MAGKTAPTRSEDDTSLPTGGMWDKQRLFGGKRLTQEFAADEAFVLWAIDQVGDVPMRNSTEVAPKTDLTVSRLTDPDSKFTVNTLSGPISKMAGEAQPSDFPVEAVWKSVPTQEPSDAVVLEAIRRWVDPATL